MAKRTREAGNAKGKGEQRTTPASIPQIHRPEVGESSRSAADRVNGPSKRARRSAIVPNSEGDDDENLYSDEHQTNDGDAAAAVIPDTGGKYVDPDNADVEYQEEPIEDDLDEEFDPEAIEAIEMEGIRPDEEIEDLSALFDGDDDEEVEEDSDDEEDDDTQSVASEHVDVDDDTTNEYMERFHIRVSEIIKTFFSIATEAGDIPESATLFRALQQHDQTELLEEVISLFPKRVRVLLGGTERAAFMASWLRTRVLVQHILGARIISAGGS
ncbi:hypothetical protein IFM58399_06264 [Aspergillus lentulus]|uniref:uncharacterized protein n=1 Tax=Aspergillus lentulus TaxID=293939 RepID=UPI001392634B|nr:uncharacterized protein IFM58399_06264 [Aspergillus lentulus]GFF41434.1 hypothetical protein IFM58399_06264 [Aspergillus lentulus]GFG11817.1 hypothetical protein IFM61392_07093 [Aspergillus lentulus]